MTVELQDLTEAMKAALKEVGFGVRKYADGYFSEDDPTMKVDGRSIQALRNRGLVQWYSSGGNPQIIFLEPTKLGWELIERLRQEQPYR